jgi:peptidase E
VLKANVISPSSEMLLTSGGVTTDVMRERLREMVWLRDYGSNINVLRIADGWQLFSRNDPVSNLARTEQYVEGPLSQVWSNRYLQWALGKRATIKTILLQSKKPVEVRALLKQTDLLVAPGANTYQLIRGIEPFAGIIRGAVARGLPYLGESAGSIIAGRTITPASLKPADTCPDIELLNAPGLGLLDADVVVHAKGTHGRFDIHDPTALVARLVLATVSSDSDKFVAKDDGTIVYSLNERQALSVQAGKIEII